jgi:hypothetical protein
MLMELGFNYTSSIRKVSEFECEDCTSRMKNITAARPQHEKGGAPRAGFAGASLFSGFGDNFEFELRCGSAELQSLI